MIGLVMISLAISGAMGDYGCICNYNVELGVFNTNSETGQPLGYMYEFDCKPQVQNELDGWLTIFFEKQLAYVKQGPNVQVQMCPGNPPEEDMLTTHHAENTTEVGWDSTTAFVSAHTTAQHHSSHSASTKLATTASTDLSTSIHHVTSATASVPTTSLTSQTMTMSTTSPAVSSTAKLQAITVTDATTTTSTLHPIMSTAAPSSTLSTSTASTTPTPSASESSTVHHTSTHSITSSPSWSSPHWSSTPTPSHNTTSSGNTSYCPAYIMNSPRGIITQHGTSCYEFITRSATWPHAELLCKKAGGHLVHISNQNNQDFIYNFLRSHFYSHPVWIGLHDRNREEHFEWTSGASLTYVNWVSDRKDYTFHDDEDCVYMDPNYLNHGKWDDVPCGDDPFANLFGGDSHAFICQYTANSSDQHTQATMPTSLQTDGDTHLCPNSVQHSLSQTSGFLAQFEGNCYALYTEKEVWKNGESRCNDYNGHLAHITTPEQQSFIQGFMQHHNPDRAVWIGLHDRIREGHFEWTSGDLVNYTNWMQGHVGNFRSPSTEDCVALIPYQNGVWDDIPCGSNGLFGETGESHYVLCQYRTSVGQGDIGLIG